MTNIITAQVTDAKINPEINTLLSYATSSHNNKQLYEDYICEHHLRLYAATYNNKYIGCIGLSTSKQHGVIKHIAVAPQFRHIGIGSSLIEYVIKQHTLTSLQAETDNDAVHFYTKLGFSIQSLGEKYAGVERFKCLLETENSP